MATIKLGTTPSANRLISYAEKRSEEREGVNCPVEYAKSQMNATRELWGKTDGIQAHHVIQSFKPGEVSPEQANEIGIKLAQDIAKGHECAVYTHTDKEHIHNHIVINSVNFENGSKYHAHGKDAIEKVRLASDFLCKERGLDVLDPNKDKKVHLDMKQIKTLEKGENRQAMLINSIAYARGISTSKDEYINEMNQLGYEVNWSDKRQRITYIDKEYQNLNEERKLEGKEGVLYRFSDNSLSSYGISMQGLSKEGLQGEFRENAREKSTKETASQERNKSNLPDEQSRGNQRNQGVVEPNARFKRPNEKLHQNEHGQIIGRESDVRQRDRKHQDNKQRSNDPNEFSFDEARKSLEKERRNVADGFKRITSRNEPQQQLSASRNEADKQRNKEQSEPNKEHNKDGIGEFEQNKSTKHRQSRTEDHELDH